MCCLTFGMHTCRARAPPGDGSGIAEISVILRASSACYALSVLSYHQTFDGLSAWHHASRHPVCAVRRHREVQAPRGYNAFCYPESCCICMCTLPRPFPLNGTSGNGACRRNHGDAAVVSRSTACPTSTAPHEWCAWRVVNGFSTARPKKRLGGRRARSSLYHTRNDY